MIPIYRAKKIDSDEYVIFNSFYEYENKYYAINKIINQTIDGWFTNVMIPLTYKIDPTTLAIHFPNMLDSQGNKIFASLSKDGKGGDILFCSGFGKNTVIYANCGIRFLGYENHKEVADFQFERIVGIQE